MSEQPEQNFYRDTQGRLMCSGCNTEVFGGICKCSNPTHSVDHKLHDSVGLSPVDGEITMSKQPDEELLGGLSDIPVTYLIDENHDGSALLGEIIYPESFAKVLDFIEQRCLEARIDEARKRVQSAQHLLDRSRKWQLTEAGRHDMIVGEELMPAEDRLKQLTNLQNKDTK